MRHLARPVQKKQGLLPDFEAVPVDVPLGGWDAISPLSKMDPKYAVTLQNWVPRTGWMEPRQGYQAWCQGLSAVAVESLMTYRPANAPEQLFAVTGGYAWDVSNQGLPVKQAIGPFANSRWQYVNFTPPLGSPYLLMVNGADGYWAYTGGVWSQPSVTGVNAALFTNINMHKQRIWFVQANSTVAWFLGTGAIQGAATSMDFGPLWSKGGHLVATGTWTIDGGLGPDDFFCAVSSRGQLALYKGTDPTNSSAWALVGVFDFPPPIGNRPFCRVGSDLWMISLEGVIPVSQGLPFDPSSVRSVAITSRIQNAMLQAAAQYQNNFGWEMIAFPAQALALLNIPVAANAQQQQYVTNMMTGAWCQFTNWNFNTFAIFNDLLYAGDNSGSVVQAYTGAADLVSPINAFMACAFNYFGDPARVKQITMVQPLMVSSGSITPTIGIAVDFNPSAVLTPAVVNVTPVGALYDVALYDSGTYAAGNSSTAQWLSAQGEGHALSIEMAVNMQPPGPGGQSVFGMGVFDTAIFDGFQGQTLTLQVNAFNVMLQKGLVV
jgi:hypothetical protein